jgi:uncharacterized protein
MSGVLRRLRYRPPVVDEAVVKEAGRILARAAGSPVKVIVFGSWARGDSRPGSDLDILVIEREVDSKLEEMVRLRDALPPLGVPVNVLVATEGDVLARGDVHGTVVNAALSEGHVLIES